MPPSPLAVLTLSGSQVLNDFIIVTEGEILKKEFIRGRHVRLTVIAVLLQYVLN